MNGPSVLFDGLFLVVGVDVEVFGMGRLGSSEREFTGQSDGCFCRVRGALAGGG